MSDIYNQIYSALVKGCDNGGSDYLLDINTKLQYDVQFDAKELKNMYSKCYVYKDPVLGGINKSAFIPGKSKRSESSVNKIDEDCITDFIVGRTYIAIDWFNLDISPYKEDLNDLYNYRYIGSYFFIRPDPFYMTLEDVIWHETGHNYLASNFLLNGEDEARTIQYLIRINAMKGNGINPEKYEFKYERK